VDSVVGYDIEQLVEKYRLPQSEAETLVPALLAYRELLVETAADRVTVPDASLRDGLLLDLVRSDQPQGIEDLRKQVLSSAAAVGERYRYDAPHARNVADLAVRLFDELRSEHGLSDRHRLLLEVAALLHDIGNYVNIRGHHKHSQYLIAASEIFGLSQDEMHLVSNVARYHRRAVPSKSHLPYMVLDREARIATNKLSAILRLANALDADHLQKVKDLHVVSEDEIWVLEVEGAGDLTMERLAALARADYLTEVFGRKLVFREARQRPWP
jgi:exopolyphosphatase/guanosine-5'-triphosphate,3'-diphosphate pyrophosphatase